MAQLGRCIHLQGTLARSGHTVRPRSQAPYVDASTAPIAAAATFGLPEATGAGRNWDYRASWVRDASFTVYAFIRLGYVEEAEAFRSWMLKRAKEADGGERLRIMYALDGGDALEETILDHLAGYAGTGPIRIGNAARQQTQLDIYGELLDSAYLSNKYSSATSHEGWNHLSSIAEYACKSWNAEDAGIWEFRDRARHLLHSQADVLGGPGSRRAAGGQAVATSTARAMDGGARSSGRGHLGELSSSGTWLLRAGAKGGTELDAALLMMPLVRFVSATDPVWLATLGAIEDDADRRRHGLSLSLLGRIGRR